MSTETTLAQRIESRISPAITSQTTLAKNGGMDFRTVDQIMEFAKIMAIAGCAVPKHLRESPGACLAVAIQACEWSMSPFAVANKSYVVNDRIGYEAQLVNAVILMRAPIKGRFKITYSGSGASRRCKVAALLTDGDTVEYESPMFSEITTKNSPLWKADPDQQLFYYSSRAMCRRHFPDVILGIYTADELQDNAEERRFQNAKPVDAVDAPQFAAVPIKHAAKAAPIAEPVTVAEVAPVAAEPTPAPAEPAPRTPSPTAIQRDLTKIRFHLKESGFSELALLNLLREAGLDESLTSLDQVADVNPSVIRATCSTWPQTLAGLKAAAAGGAL